MQLIYIEEVQLTEIFAISSPYLFSASSLCLEGVMSLCSDLELPYV